MKLTVIYDCLSKHPAARRISCLVMTSVLAWLAFSLKYSEDISDFLPFGTSDREALSVYQSVSGADDLYILFGNPDNPDLTLDAMDFFASVIRSKDTLGWCRDLTFRIDFNSISEVAEFVYGNIPYFLTEADYHRMDSLLATPGYVEEQLHRNKEMLSLPSGGILATNISRDPLGLFSPVLSKLGESDNKLNFEIYGGYIFTPDMRYALAMMSSPFGNSETDNNSKLLSMLDDAVARMETEYPDVTAHVAGGPVIAVGNAERIKKDSVIAVSVSIILIILFLYFSFGSFRNIMLILLSVGWGWMFAMGGMALFSNSVSIIVIGISSVILGIAVNYPLHLIAHSCHEPDMRKVLKEITAPLIIGNVTTVGAFLALVPLKSTALRDLGVFSALLLAGTILFVLICLPHLIETRKGGKWKGIGFIDRASHFSPENSKVVVICSVIITLVLGAFSFRAEFDSDMAGINYMTGRQREDIRYFQELMAREPDAPSQPVYILSSGNSYDEALAVREGKVELMRRMEKEGVVKSRNNLSQFFASRKEQEHRISLWRDFVARHGKEFYADLPAAGRADGFTDTAFAPFNSVVAKTPEFKPQDMEFFSPLTQLIFSRNFTGLKETGRFYVVDIVDVEEGRAGEVKSAFEGSFDTQGMNGALTGNLSDNFNYIGWACSLIVFFFLWFSFGRVELALISFIPMAVSWLWILGIMAMTGIKFNIVNIILATFIFGQGDDYTIFMTEGCQYEYTYRRPILASHKSSILQSALIMFVGMGTLLVARHPAMRSLAEITVIGMFSVVAMAYIIPPYLFKLLTVKNGAVRERPVTLSSILNLDKDDPVSRVRGRYVYKRKEILSTVRRNLKESSFLPDIEIEQGTPFVFEDNGYGEQAILLALTHRNSRIIAVLADEDRKRVAEISASGFVENIEFKIKNRK